ncbi:hypothetical protein OIE68_45865 [Nocardia vinacea]|uniref:hypothetical protein n=1 Tax=Nocardia vinacea TaxID=96468 RepID=UPI002E129593|nr:hypothetical protein OIE68_45865 [Nocardia vinacea]
MIDALRPPALDRDGNQVPHRFLDTYWRPFINQHRGNRTLTQLQLQALDDNPHFYLEFFAQQLAAARRAWNPEQAVVMTLTLCDVIDTPVAQFDHRWWPHPGAAMATRVRTGATVAHHNERWRADWDVLARVCESWRPEEAFAVLGAITRHRAVGRDGASALHAVGLLP